MRLPGRERCTSELRRGGDGVIVGFEGGAVFVELHNAVREEIVEDAGGIGGEVGDAGGDVAGVDEGGGLEFVPDPGLREVPGFKDAVCRWDAGGY